MPTYLIDVCGKTVPLFAAREGGEILDQALCAVRDAGGVRGIVHDSVSLGLSSTPREGTRV